MHGETSASLLHELGSNAASPLLVSLKDLDPDMTAAPNSAQREKGKDTCVSLGRTGSLSGGPEDCLLPTARIEELWVSASDNQVSL